MILCMHYPMTIQHDLYSNFIGASHTALVEVIFNSFKKNDGKMVFSGPLSTSNTKLYYM